MASTASAAAPAALPTIAAQAESLGYKVLVAEGSPLVLKIIVGGYVDAIVGVACLNVLEKAIDKILLAGIPCMAVPLLSSDCRNTSVDDAWVKEMIHLEHRQTSAPTRTYVHLMRAAAAMFEREQLETLLPRVRSTAGGSLDARSLDPLAATEAIAYDFLAQGGKYSRPFITLSVHDALTGGAGMLAGGAEHLAALPLPIKRAALAIEIFHKASLVHDDIEDDDAFRYGNATVHRRYGVSTAINVGDYMIGLGYRMVSRETEPLGPAVAADILNCLADAHMKLAEGQGAELLWRDAADKRLSPLDALKIYALKTAPAFEAALYVGARLAGDASSLTEPLAQFARHLGVAFQILNDLADWRGDAHNKLTAGADVLSGRPTVLLALAGEALEGPDRDELYRLVAPEANSAAEADEVSTKNPRPLDAAAASSDAAGRLQGVRRLYEKAAVFEKAERLVDKYRARAESVADAIEGDDLRALLYYFVDTVLDAPADRSAAPIVSPSRHPGALPIVAPS